MKPSAGCHALDPATRAERERALEDEEGLVLSLMAVRRRCRAGRHRDLDDRHRPAAGLRRHEDPHARRPELDPFGVFGSERIHRQSSRAHGVEAIEARPRTTRDTMTATAAVTGIASA